MEFAKVINWEPEWSLGAPCPQVFSDGNKTYLTYNAKDDNETSVLVTFDADTFRFGIVNDEAAAGHPLNKKGLQVYSAHLIENSSWIEELKQIHRIHPRYSEERWTSLKHYLLFFHDQILEVVAESYKIEVSKLDRKTLALDVANKLLT